MTLAATVALLPPAAEARDVGRVASACGSHGKPLVGVPSFSSTVPCSTTHSTPRRPRWRHG